MPRQDGPARTSTRSEVLATPKKYQITEDGPQVVLASAAVMSESLSRFVATKMKPEAWQNQSWNYFDTIGEFRDSATWVGNILSKAKLTIVRRGAPLLPDGKPDLHPEAVAALQDFFGGEEGQSEMLRMFGIHFTVAGEAYIISTTPKGATDDDPDEWEVIASTEISAPGRDGEGKEIGQWKIDEQPLDDALVIRCWKAHPRKRFHADAPARAVLTVLNQIKGLSEHIDAQIESRLSSAGLLVIPQEMTFGSTPTETSDADGATVSATQHAVNEFVAELIKVFAMARTDRSSAAARVPGVLAVPGEFVDKVQFLTFWTELDKEAIALRQEAIRRLALGMDMPPEILTGTGDLNHWSSWQVEESSIKARTEPLLAVLTRSLTIGYLRPRLRVAGMSAAEANEYSIGADTSMMRLRPNRSQEALELNDRGVLSDLALLRENGFTDVDAMDEKGLIKWLARTTAKGQTTPEIVQAAQRYLGLILEAQHAVDGDAPPADDDDEPVHEQRPTPSLEDHPSRELPDPIVGDGVRASGFIIATRAIERAGGRLRNNMGGAKIEGATQSTMHMHVRVNPDQVDSLTADAWEQCAMVGPTFGVNTTDLENALRGYVREVLLRKRDHSMESFAQYLRPVASRRAA